MIEINSLQAGPGFIRPMHQTYELYIRSPDGNVQFRPLTHAGPLSAVMAEVRGLLGEIGALSIEVRTAGGPPLFVIDHGG